MLFRPGMTRSGKLNALSLSVLERIRTPQSALFGMSKPPQEKIRIRFDDQGVKRYITKNKPNFNTPLLELFDQTIVLTKATLMCITLLQNNVRRPLSEYVLYTKE